MGSFEEAEKKKADENSAKLRREAEIKFGATNAAHRFVDDLTHWLGISQKLDVQAKLEGGGGGNVVVLTHARHQMSVTFNTETSCLVVGVDSSPLTTNYDEAREKVMEWVNNKLYIAKTE